METDNKEIWVLDCDTGIDDVFALIQLLGMPEKIKLVAITTVNGNTRLENVVINTLKALQLLNREVDVYIGCEEPIVCEKLTVHNNFHSCDGFGGVEEFKSMKGFTQCLKEEHAVEALIRLGEEYKGRLNILAIGPYTNLALAARLDPSFSSKVARLVFMGGAHWGMGNTNCNGEHNVYSDPEAFKICLDEYAEKIQLVTWECTLGHEFVKESYDKIFDNTTKVGFLLDRITKQIRTQFGLLTQMCDHVAAVVAVDPSIIKKEMITHCDVERHSPECQGQTLLLWPHNHYYRTMKREELAKLKKIRVVMETDIPRTLQIFLDCLKNFEPYSDTVKSGV